MKVAIVGAGFTGLSAAIELIDKGHEVVVFEADKRPGGMGIGFKAPGWKWSLERYYHHIFANDEAAIKLSEKVGLSPFFKIPKTNSFTENKEVRLDSVISLITFPYLSFFSRLRMGLGLLVLKLTKNGIFLEKYKASELLPLFVGKEGYKKIWSPLLSAKFGPYLPKVNMAWFWARVFKRTQSLGYFEGGYQALADKIVSYVNDGGGKVKLFWKVGKIKQMASGKWQVADDKFDKVLVTVPAPMVDRIIGEGTVIWPEIDYLSAQTIVLELNKSLIKGYWLNILEKDFPFMVVVEHTNLIDRRYYGGKTIVYLGNYLPNWDKRLKMSEEQLIKLYLPYLKKINAEFNRGWISRAWCFETPYAQPVFPVNYSYLIPPIKTKLPGLFVANMSMVYPWDRGTNYAIKLGRDAASFVSLVSDEKSSSQGNKNNNH